MNDTVPFSEQTDEERALWRLTKAAEYVQRALVLLIERKPNPEWAKEMSASAVEQLLAFQRGR